MSRRRNRHQRRSRRTNHGQEQKDSELEERPKEPEQDDHSEDLELSPQDNHDEAELNSDEDVESQVPLALSANTDETNDSDDDNIATSPPLRAESRPRSTPGPETEASAQTIPMPALDESTVYNGDILRQIREHLGISLKTISSITRIGVPSLMAVEEERFEDLPNARIYVLGFVRCLAKEIGLDSEIASKSYITRWQHWWDARSEEDRRSYR